MERRGGWKEGLGRLSSRHSKNSSDWGQIDVTMATTGRQGRKERMMEGKLGKWEKQVEAYVLDLK